MRTFYTLLFAFPLLLSCEKNTENHTIAISWELIKNNYQGESKNLSKFVVENKSSRELNDNWEFYFNYPRSIDTSTVSGKLSIVHINGDFYKMFPCSDWDPLPAGSSMDVEFVSTAWNINKTDAPAGAYFVFDSKSDSILPCNIQVIDFIRDKQTKRSANDKVKVETAQMRYLSNKHIGALESACPIIPTPSLYEMQEGVCSINNNVEFICDNSQMTNELNYLKGELNKLLTDSDKSNGPCKITLKQEANLKTSYVLDIKPEMILILGRNAECVFNGVQSLLAMIPTESYNKKQSSIELKCVHIFDTPAFPYRGLMVDVGRNFQSKDEILKIIDVMARYKLNKFHFHFCDDEGWRLEVKDLPELTEYGSVRKHEGYDKTNLPPSFGSGAFSSASGTGYYSASDFVEILKYAKARHIEIIPEIDVPGHSRAAIKSMEYRYHKYMSEGNSAEAFKYLLTDLDDNSEYSSVQGWTDNVMCVANEATYRFFSKVLETIQKYYAEAGIELKNIHVGGDEVPHGAWLGSPKVKNFAKQNKLKLETDALFHYFMLRLCDTLSTKGITMSGWEEIGVANDKKLGKIAADAIIGRDVVPYVWNTVGGWGSEDLAYKLANAGIDVVMSSVSNIYLDLAYAKDPNEPGYYWGGFNDTKKAWEFTPYDVSQCVKSTPLGKEINWCEGEVSSDDCRPLHRLTERGRKHIIGMQGQLWAENLKSAELLEYCTLPKMLGLAERAWCGHPQWAGNEDAKQRAWSDFAKRVGKHALPRLDKINGGYLYRIPPVGALVDAAKKVHLNVLYPSLTIRYTTDSTEPNASSKLYVEPIDFVTGLKATAFDSRGRSGRTIELH
ncbi:MAG: family 20 glycosylhydrolase [Bacteroidales bacterium]